jgi:RNA polymerase sigma-B factor
MTHELGRRPSVPEVAERLDTAAEQVGEAMGAVANCLNVHSLDMPTDGTGTIAVRDSLGAEDHDLETAPERIALRPLVAALDDRDRKIIVLRFVRGYTQRRIADEVGLSQTQVCRLLDRILADLRAQLEESPSPTLV